jgi:hypothetical protein
MANCVVASGQLWALWRHEQPLLSGPYPTVQWPVGSCGLSDLGLPLNENVHVVRCVHSRVINVVSETEPNDIHVHVRGRASIAEQIQEQRRIIAT